MKATSFSPSYTNKIKSWNDGKIVLIMLIPITTDLRWVDVSMNVYSLRQSLEILKAGILERPLQCRLEKQRDRLGHWTLKKIAIMNIFLFYFILSKQSSKKYHLLSSSLHRDTVLISVGFINKNWHEEYCSKIYI